MTDSILGQIVQNTNGIIRGVVLAYCAYSGYLAETRRSSQKMRATTAAQINPQNMTDSQEKWATTAGVTNRQTAV